MCVCCVWERERWSQNSVWQFQFPLSLTHTNPNGLNQKEHWFRSYEWVAMGFNCWKWRGCTSSTLRKRSDRISNEYLNLLRKVTKETNILNIKHTHLPLRLNFIESNPKTHTQIHKRKRLNIRPLFRPKSQKWSRDIFCIPQKNKMEPLCQKSDVCPLSIPFNESDKTRPSPLPSEWDISDEIE